MSNNEESKLYKIWVVVDPDDYCLVRAKSPEEAVLNLGGGDVCVELASPEQEFLWEVFAELGYTDSDVAEGVKITKIESEGEVDGTQVP